MRAPFRPHDNSSVTSAPSQHYPGRRFAASRSLARPLFPPPALGLARDITSVVFRLLTAHNSSRRS